MPRTRPGQTDKAPRKSAEKPAQIKKPGPGRPKRHQVPRRATTIRISEESFAWMEAHLPRSVAMSDFVNEAISEKIARVK